jgi:DNA repair exonuclease SbcCD ATPase subunit
MRINKVEINNFYSFHKASVDFDKYTGVVLIEGENKDAKCSVGSGKSAILEAVTYGLFGSTIRKSNEQSLVNAQRKKKLVVRVTVNDNVVIERGRRPTTLTVHIDGKNCTKDNARATQRFIEEYLNINYKVFLASTVFGQKNNTDFLSASPDDKREMLKNFLNLDKLFELRDSVKFLKSQYSQKIKAINALIDEANNQKKEQGRKIEEINQLKAEISSDISKEALKYSLEDILADENHNADVAREIRTQEKEIVHYKNAISDLENQEAKCNKCGSELKYDKKKTKQDLQVFEGKIKGIELFIEKKRKTIKDIVVSSRDYHKIAKYNELTSNQEVFQDLLEECKKKIDAWDKEQQDYNNKYEVMRFWEKAFSESGLVKYIIRNVLDFLNAKVNYYLSYLSQGRFVLKFDEELRETIYNNHVETSYISLSGGESKKVSLAVMLGLQHILSLSRKNETNMIFLDEIAESLDNEGLEGLYTLLLELKKDRTLFLITHNTYLKSLIDSAKVIRVTKHKGISTIE